MEKKTKQSSLRMPTVDGSTTPAPPWDRMLASWSPPSTPISPKDNVPSPSGQVPPAMAPHLHVPISIIRGCSASSNTSSQGRPFFTSHCSQSRVPPPCYIGMQLPQGHLLWQLTPPWLTHPGAVAVGETVRKAKGFSWFETTHGARTVLHDGNYQQMPGTRSRLMATC